MIASFLAGVDRAGYESDEMLQAAVERKFTIIGEALSQLSKLYHEIAARVARLREVVGVRNILIHAYTIVVHDRVWTITQKPLAELRASVEGLMNELESPKL